jgi:hypothetical protein
LVELKPEAFRFVVGNKNVWGAVLRVGEKEKLARFEQIILPHLDAAYNLARWLYMPL